MHELGQYFTKDEGLQAKVFELIKNDTHLILEPSVGRGDLVRYITNQDRGMQFDMYEIDQTIELLPEINTTKLIYGDFLKQEIEIRYKTIVGNPPYVKTKKGNLYIDFIRSCFDLLDVDGELIFIIPSDFFKLTSAISIINDMMNHGTFTHVYHPNNEHLFENATVDIIVFRYQRTEGLEHVCLYNDETKHIINSNGLITFSDELLETTPVSEYFDVYVGMVSGKDSVFKSTKHGNIKVLNAKDQLDSFVFYKQYPTEDKATNEYLLSHKDALIERRIRKFDDNNWYQWGAPRNLLTIEKYKDMPCIYMHNLTRKAVVAFADKIQYFGGNLIMLKPKKELELCKIVEFLNSDDFKKNYEFSGRFKIGQRQIMNIQVPLGVIKMI